MKYTTVYIYIVRKYVLIFGTLCVQSAEEQEDAASATAKNSLSKGYYSRKRQSDVMMMMMKLMILVFGNVWCVTKVWFSKCS